VEKSDSIFVVDVWMGMIIWNGIKTLRLIVLLVQISHSTMQNADTTPVGKLRVLSFEGIFQFGEAVILRKHNSSFFVTIVSQVHLLKLGSCVFF